MKKWEKEILEKQIKHEYSVLCNLEESYKMARETVDEKIQVLQSKQQTPSVINQLKYQKSLENQLNDVYQKMSSKFYYEIDDYLTDCYEESFYSTMYALNQEGISIIIPFDQAEAVAAAAQSEFYGIELSQKLYNDAYELARVTRQEITRGIATGSSFADIARKINKRGEATLKQAYRIARTEGHRIHEETKFKTVNKVKDKGADIVKQWDSTVDKRTRPSHVALDGQLREIEQPFKSPVSGKTAQYPGGFGVAKEDIHCRCTSLQRARWALDKSELEKYVGDLSGMSAAQLKDLADKFGVSTDELIKKSNGIINADGSVNHLIKANNYNQFKKKYQKKVAAAAAIEQKQIDNSDEIDKLKKSLKDEQEKLDFAKDKKYSGLWKDDVSLSDYKYKKNSIQAKKDYFLQQIAAATSQSEIDLFQSYLDDLDEFASMGAKYEIIENEVSRLKGEIKKLTPAGSLFSDDRKNNALWFDKDHGGFDAADNYFDPPSKKIHSSASASERDGFYTYTRSSGGHNRPLAGFQKPWDKSGTGWEDRYNVGAKKVWIDYEGKGDQIRGLTTLIDKSEYTDDIWLQSGQNFETIEGFLNIPKGTLQNMNDAELEQFVGQQNVIYNFLSTAVNEGGGAMFNERPLKINFYAPEGSKMLYASDEGAFGKGENEMILQRGGTYEITKIYWGIDETDNDKKKIFVDMDIHPEKGYDTFQQDPEEWQGSRENYQS